MITGELSKGDPVLHIETGNPYLVVSTAQMKVNDVWAPAVIYAFGRTHPEFTHRATSLFVRPEPDFRQAFRRIPR